jgi:hypothetical protein
LVLRGEQSGLLTHIATMESVSLYVADEKLTAFLELETAIRPTSAELHFLTKPALATQFPPQGSQLFIRAFWRGGKQD